MHGNHARRGLKKTVFSGTAIVVIFALIIAMTTTVPYTQTAVAAKKIEGTEGNDRIVGTPGNDNIDSKGGSDVNFGDTVIGDGSGDDKINSGKGDDVNFGDTTEGTGSGDDKINAGQGDDELTGNGGADKFQCGKGEDTVTDFKEEEGDKATGNCENI
jgi:Ca2+-binding RTX toxin-like protein